MALCTWGCPTPLTGGGIWTPQPALKSKTLLLQLLHHITFLLLGVELCWPAPSHPSPSSLETVRELGVVLEQLNFVCEYIHDDLPEDHLPTTLVCICLSVCGVGRLACFVVFAVCVCVACG